MSELNLHFLNAQNRLTSDCGWLRRALEVTFAKASQQMLLPSLDVVIKAGKAVIPEKGHLGYCPESGLICITVDPHNSALRQNNAQSLERMFAHELHHAARWACVGYGTTPGGAMVSEGLAGHFALEVFGGGPEPWESLSDSDIKPWLPFLEAHWSKEDYDHSALFYGSGQLPRWLGYSAGFRLISRYIAANPGKRASLLVGEPAEIFRPFLLQEAEGLTF